MHLFSILSSPFLQSLLTIAKFASCFPRFFGLSDLFCLHPHPANIPSALEHRCVSSPLWSRISSTYYYHSALTYGSARPWRQLYLSSCQKKQSCPSNVLLATHSPQWVGNGANVLSNCKESSLKLKKTTTQNRQQQKPKQMSWNGRSTNCCYSISAGKIPHCLTHSAFFFMWEGKLCFQMLCTAHGDNQAFMDDLTT